MTKNNTKLNVYISEDIKTYLKITAEEKDRSVGYVVRDILKKYIKKDITKKVL